MGLVQFEDQIDPSYSRNIEHKIKQTRMVRLVMKLGLAKDENSANIVFIVVTIISIVLAVIIYLYFVLGYNPFVVKVVPRSQSINDLLRPKVAGVSN